MATTTKDTTRLLSLPLELLEQIADLAGGAVLIYDWRYSPSSFNEEELANPLLGRQRLQTICNLRLVNKRLYDAASRVLLPTLRVEISQKSLLRAERLLGIPQIALGIHSVQVFAAYYHHGVATSLGDFAIFKEGHVNDWEDKCFTAHDGDYSGHPEDGEKLLAMGKLLSKLQRVCNEIYVGVGMIDSQFPAQRAIAQEAFEHFQTQRQEQQYMLTTGKFVTRLASLMTPLAGLRSLCIKDVDAPDNLTDLQLATLIRTISSRELLFKIMAEPMCWVECSESGTPDINAQVTAATLLCDIPIALNRAGVRLQQLQIRCLPPRRSMEFLDPQNCVLDGTYAELKQALGSLSQFDLTLYREGFYSIPVVLSNYHFITTYLKLCLSGPCLQNFHLHLHELLVDLLASNQSDDDDSYFDLRNVLSEISTSRLRKVCISSAIVSRANMVNICQKLGSHTILCFLTDLHLSDGSWGDVIQMMSGVIGSRLITANCISRRMSE